jgi:two-component system CheB/CheR fusion protein
MAFILAWHTDPSHDGQPTALIQPWTHLRVVEARDGTPLEPDTVYVLPPDTSLGLRDGRLEIGPPTEVRGVRRPIDHVFRVLARALGSGAAGVVLSGAGGDGAAGLRELKIAGGLTIARQVGDGEQVGMPHGAVDAGAVDLALAPGEIPEALARYARLPREVWDGDDAGQRRPALALTADMLSRIGAILLEQAGFDLAHYKTPTIRRRVLRRAGLAGFESLDPYVDRLRSDPVEQQSLLRDLLIGVTEFFRNPEAFDTLRTAAIADLIRQTHGGETLRAWVPACATGEEAYSLAIVLLEEARARDKRLRIQVFATDVDEDALAVGRAGIYPPSISEQVSEERRREFFVELSGRGYQVRPHLRDAVSFAVHDLTNDPPFSRMDLVSCRNVLIYMRPETQQHVIRLLHFALRSDGYLFLGTSESVGAQRELFGPVSKSWRIYRKLGTSRPMAIPRSGVGTRHRIVTEPIASAPTPARPKERGPADLAREALLETRVPPSVVVGGDGRILYGHGDLGPYLRFPRGEPRLELTTVLRDDLKTRVRAAVYKCHRDIETVTVLSSPDTVALSQTRITVSPAPKLGEGALILSFEDVAVSAVEPSPVPGASSDDAALIDQIERELQATREDLRSTVEELETSNEELRAAHEESMSMNEELQSANEELEATTEELRSLNEELATVNARLKEKVDQLEQAHNDLGNFFASTKLATVFLDEGLRIKRFSPAAEELLELTPAHAGRFVGDVGRDLLRHDLQQDARSVLGHLMPTSRELRAPDDRWFVRRVLPYRSEARTIGGVVVNFVDITELKRAADRLGARERQQAVIARFGLQALRGDDLESLLDQIVREVCQTLGADFCELLEVQPGRRDLLLRGGVGWREGAVGNVRIGLGPDSHAGYTLGLGEPVIAEDLRAERRFTPSPLLQEHGVTSGLACVIQDNQGAYGVLGVHTRERRLFTGDDANFLQAAANVIAGAVSREYARRRLGIERGVARVLAEARSFDEAAPRLLRAFFRELRASVGELWIPTAGDEELHCSLLLAPSNPILEGDLRAEFTGGAFHRGEGLIGNAWERRRAVWFSVLDDPRELARMGTARSLGLVCGFAFPILAGNVVLGVISLFSRERLVPDEALENTVDALGRAIGEFAMRTRAEQAVRASEERLRLAVAAARALVYDTDIHRATTTVRGADLLLDDAPEPDAPTDWWIDRIHPDDRDRFRAAMHEGSGARDGWRLEYRLRHRDGHFLDVEDHGQLICSPEGTPTQRIGVVIDVTDRRRAEHSLRQSEWRFRQMLAHAPVPMMVFDEAGHVLELSRAWTDVTGYAAGDLPTVEHWARHAVPDDAPRVLARLRSFGEADDTRTPAELSVRTRDGAQRTLLLTTTPLGTLPDGRRIGICAGADISDRKRAEEALQEADRQKDQFLAMLSHELRNPLAAIRAASELLKLSDVRDAALERTRTVLARQTEHMARLVDGLLDVSRIVRGKIKLDLETLDLAALIRELLQDQSDAIAARDIDLRLDLPTQPIIVKGDRVRLAQVLDNLLANALKFTTPPGTVTVAARAVIETAEVCIRDTGVGIEPDLLPHIFEPFRQGAQSLDRAKGGLGLGLALVKGVVEMHGGTVVARSDGSGRGAELTVRLPLAPRRPRPAAAVDPNAARHRLLVVEDNHDAADLLSTLLQTVGHEVAVAYDGAQAIALARELRPDAILCDVGLPGEFNGYDVARALKADRDLIRTILIALTGYGRPEDKALATDAGFDDHLTKPVDLAAIQEVLGRLLP